MRTRENCYSSSGYKENSSQSETSVAASATELSLNMKWYGKPCFNVFSCHWECHIYIPRPIHLIIRVLCLASDRTENNLHRRIYSCGFSWPKLMVLLQQWSSWTCIHLLDQVSTQAECVFLAPSPQWNMASYNTTVPEVMANGYVTYFQVVISQRNNSVLVG